MKTRRSFLACNMILVLFVVYGFAPNGQALNGEPTQTQTQAENQIRERLKDQVADFWIYDDLKRGYEQAKTSGRPLLVSFRCVP